MGMRLFGSRSSYDSPNEPAVKTTTHVVKKRVFAPNPDPRNYKIIKAEDMFDHLILMVYFPGCDSYEGLKILIFDEGVTLHDIARQGSIDPHFSKNPNYISPLARFEPTDRGWEMAKELAFWMPRAG
jgi:hypothetical protein